jgi:cytochrome c-type biogenesis protein CcmH/NrfG
MKRNVLIAIVAVLGAVALTMLLYRWPASDSGPLSVEAATARRMWSSMDNSSERKHELRVLEDSLKQNPDHAPILLRMAQVSRELGKGEEALQHLREAVKVDPKNREARLELGRALFEAGDVEGAIRETEDLLKLDPSNTDGLYNLGAIYGNIGQEDRAREFWRKAVAIAPESESGHRARNALEQIGG